MLTISGRNSTYSRYQIKLSEVIYSELSTFIDRHLLTILNKVNCLNSDLAIPTFLETLLAFHGLNTVGNIALVALKRVRFFPTVIFVQVHHVTHSRK